MKGGYAYSDNRETLLLAGVPQAFAFDKNHRDGWTVGAGLEYMFAPNWSAKAEYQYYDFGRATFVTPAVLAPFGSFRNDEHTVKVGINYRLRRSVARWLRSTDRQTRISLCGKGRRKPAFFVAVAQKLRRAASGSFPTC